MRLVCFYILVVFPAILSAREKFYPVIEIPEHLIENADAVVRYEENTLSILSKSSAKLEKYKVITVLNEEGVEFGTFLGFYDKDLKIGSVAITIYDQYGNLLEKVKNKDIKDYSAISGFSLYEDNRVLYYKPFVNQYPFTVEIGCTYTYSGVAYLPPWIPQGSNIISVVESKFAVNTSKDVGIHYKAMNLDTEAVLNQAGSTLKYFWQVKDIQAFEDEPFMVDFRKMIPMLYIFPNQISLHGYSGKINTWQDLGQWIQQLNFNQNKLPEECRMEVQAIKDASRDTLDLLRNIYKYLQDNTRYVSIQYGIGGYQPFDAETVYEKGYGDCKALSNFTVALLEEVGIEAHYTIISAGENALPLLTDMPGLQFNHVIVSVPLANDTIWLECTSQDMPFGYLGSFTDDRYGLSITGQGGDLVRTTDYQQNDNILSCFSSLDLSAQGNAQIKANLKFTGFLYDNIHGFINDDYKEQKNWWC